MMAGHSLGEYSALVCAGSLAFGEAIALVRRRAELMQNAVPAGEGAMAAVLGLEDEAIVKVCEMASSAGVAEAVNFNSPGQVVVAGHRAAIERLIELAKEAGARRAIMLAVSVPSHSSLMRPAGEALAESLDAANLDSPSIPVVCAVDGTPYGDAEDIRERMKRQVFSPVRWVDTIEHNHRKGRHGISVIVECGPGKVSRQASSKRIDRGTFSILHRFTSDALQKIFGRSRLMSLFTNNMHLKVRWHWLPVHPVELVRPLRGSLADAGATVIGTATSENGAADAISEVTG